MTDELRKKDEPIKVQLGSREYELSPLNANVLAHCEDEFGEGVDKVPQLLSKRPHSTLLSILYALLQDNYPELSKADIGRLYSIDDYERLSGQAVKALTINLSDNTKKALNKVE
ncbi:MAG: hypothetical protein PHI12_14545 [Dehalococcoidales bacterium]|nr:hypothetical protein [Dehalococcoidales bacterium]